MKKILKMLLNQTGDAFCTSSNKGAAGIIFVELKGSIILCSSAVGYNFKKNIKLISFEHVEGIRLYEGISNKNVYVDSSFNAEFVYKSCKKYGFTPIKIFKTKIKLLGIGK